MNKCIAAVSALALIVIAGCTSRPTPMTDVSTAITHLPLVQGQRDELSRIGPMSLRVGDEPIRQSGIMHLRVCDKEKTECKLGFAKLKANLYLVSLNKNDATFKVDLEFDVGQMQTISDDLSSVAAKMPDDLPTLHRQYKRSAENITVDYNRISRIDLPYGVAYKLCVEAPVVEQDKRPRGCRGQEVEILRVQE